MEKVRKLCDELIGIGRSLENQQNMEATAYLQASKRLAEVLSEAEEEDAFLPYSRLVESLELDEYERLLVCLLWYLEAETHTDISWKRAKECLAFCKRDNQRPLAICFWNYEERVCLSPVTIAFLMGEVPQFGEGICLAFPKKEKCYGIEGFLQIGKEIISQTELLQSEPAAWVLSADEGSGRHFLAEQLAAREGFALLTITAQEAIPEKRRLNDVVLFLQLYNAILCVEYVKPLHQRGIKELSKYVPFIILIQDKGEVHYEDVGYILNIQELPFPNSEVKREMLLDFLEKKEPAVKLTDGLTENMLMSKQLPTGKYIRFLKSVYMRLLLGSEVSEKEIHAASSPQLTWLPANRSFEELKLPQQQELQLRKICGIIGARKQVLEKWGYGKKYKYGNGISVLFYGAPGTGKTMAAQVLANTLGMPLFRVDLSQLTSKYIGETQKNIGKIFEEAKKNECILLFDEADAIFAKRSEVSDAQDRYSNAETAYLLQCIEQYDGVAVLATNLLQNFDEAFRRRITYILHFPMPDEMLRVQLWQSVFPEEAAISAEVDYEVLAKAFEMSGAAIKNAAFHASCCAWAEGSEIGMKHLLDGIQNEYLKTGKSFNEEQRQLQKTIQEG